MKAINIAKQNIEKFHKSQFIEEQVIETSEGVECWRKSVAIEKGRAIYSLVDRHHYSQRC